jgi:SET domain-containing protein
VAEPRRLHHNGFFAGEDQMSKKEKASAKIRKIEARQSEIHGNGVFAIAPIAEGERVVRYKGALRTHDEVDAEYGDVDEDGHTFLFTLNDEYVIDGNVDGNIARWINHSCAPNCEAVIEEDDRDRRHKDKVLIQAMRDIRPGEELTYNYGIVLDERHTPKLKKLWGCRCGAPKCTGTMLQPKR